MRLASVQKSRSFHKEVCEQFDLQDGALRRWVKQVEFERNGGVPETAALTPEQQEIQVLKAKINKLEREKSILKKAAAFLVSDEILLATRALWARAQCQSIQQIKKGPP